MIADADLSFSKIFVTGVFGSGKTTAALEISKMTGLAYKSFDANWSYKKIDRAYAARHLHSLGARFVTDAIAFSASPDPYFSFTQFYDKHPGEVLIFCMTCLDIAQWTERLKSKQNTPTDEHAKISYIDFHTVAMPMHKGKNIRYYDTASGSYVSDVDIHNYVELIS